MAAEVGTCGRSRAQQAGARSGGSYVATKWSTPSDTGTDPPPLPTAELHVHIEGTLEPELALALAVRNRIPLRFPGLDEVRRAYAFRDLRSFLGLYYELSAVLRQPQDLVDLVDVYLARAAAECVRHAEVFVDPQAHLTRGVPLEVVMDGLGEAYGAAGGCPCGPYSLIQSASLYLAELDGLAMAARPPVVGRSIGRARPGPSACVRRHTERARTEVDDPDRAPWWSGSAAAISTCAASQDRGRTAS